MPIWDDIKDILQSIDSKLGGNAPKRAGVLGDVLPKRKEKSKEAQLQSLEGTIQKAFSRIPILNQLVPVITGFRDTLRDLLAMRGLFVGLGDFGKAFKGVMPTLKSYAAAMTASRVNHAESVMNRALTPGAREILGGDFIRGLAESFAAKPPTSLTKFRALHVAQQLEIFKKLGTGGTSELGKKIAKGLYTAKGNIKGTAAFAGRRAGIFASTIRSLLAPIIAALSTVAGAIIAGIAAAVLAVFVATAAVIGFAKHLVYARKHLAKLNATYAIAFAMSDIRKIFRDMRSAVATSATTAKFLQVWNDFLDKIQPIFDELFNLFVRFATVLLQVVNFIIDNSPDFREVANAALSVPMPWGLKTAMDMGGFGPYDAMRGAVDWLWGAGAKNDAAKDAHDGKIMSLMEKANKAMDLIIKAHEADLEGAVPVTAAAFMAGVAGSGYRSTTVPDMNLRPDLDVIWNRHKELK